MRWKSSHKAPSTQPVAPTTHALQSTAQLQSQSYTPQAPVVQGTGYPVGNPQYPVYNTPSQCYGSPALQAPAPYISQSTVNLAPPRPPKEKEVKPKASWLRMDKMAAKSYGDLRATLVSGAGKSCTQVNQYIDQSTALCKKSTQALNQGAALCDLISTKLDAVITSIDTERFSGQEQDLIIYDNSPAFYYPDPNSLHPEAPRTYNLKNQVYRTETEATGSNHFSKVWAYSNSRLPPHLPPFKVYINTYPLLCLAAKYSERVYTPPSDPKSSEHETHVPSNWRSGTKAMVLKTIPCDDVNTVVFAIRGSQTFMDWAVNFRPAPSSPEGFIDDEGNLCHSGFLQVARQMIKPVASRLRILLQENPSRSNCSLLITGHSAGGAVAALLYAHMMSTSVSSELNHLTGFFKRVHCVTFGAPPVSLLPLQKPRNARHRKSLFFSFINEGDPVPRADKNVVKSLLKLYAAPAPSSKSKLSASSTSISAPMWNIPPSTLSTAGRIVVLRQIPAGKGEDNIEAVTVDDEILRSVVYGDPVKHMMSLYRARVEKMAVDAVTGVGY
ncbi:alpha/beta-hydrolase [Amniculicola lignicola CBS 123094]|uniref:Alpha/beta-hydrolase n=1 Tax=Amniculicola lignicola CBS 123094 TaxID=1392246 RepID=A0A6A5WRE3_9PLEO|nr:alpha/beta-hydrolase [Amniculicola lignicola CBS 123094]